LREVAAKAVITTSALSQLDPAGQIEFIPPTF
jgi:hypothetical protein